MRNGQQSFKRGVHSARETWNLKSDPLECIVFYQGLMVRFHVGLEECISRFCRVSAIALRVQVPNYKVSTKNHSYDS